MIQSALFYLFSGTMIASALMVVAGRNPVHSVLFLILAFLNAAGLFLLAGAELLALIMVIVYVGAVAVLFLFVVMMLDIDFRDLRKGIAQYGVIGLFVGIILAGELITIGVIWKSHKSAEVAIAQPIPKALSNAHALGEILYTDYILLFQLSGVVLLVAMIGAIVLTLRTRAKVRHQDYQEQLKRNPANSLRMVKVASGQGILGEKG
jgi:NADH-quinone oxidoreductase subunit J